MKIAILKLLCRYTRVEQVKQIYINEYHLSHYQRKRLQISKKKCHTHTQEINKLCAQYMSKYTNMFPRSICWGNPEAMTTSSKPNIQILVLKYHSSINRTRAPWKNKDFEVWQVSKGKEELKRVGGTQQGYRSQPERATNSQSLYLSNKISGILDYNPPN